MHVIDAVENKLFNLGNYVPKVPLKKVCFGTPFVYICRN